MAKYTVQHLGYPTAGTIRPDQWKEYSTHKTLSAAYKRIERELSYLEHGTWNDHYRVLGPDGLEIDYERYRDWRIDKMTRV